MKEVEMLLFDKRGLSHHIEMVISFTLFVTFVFFIVLFVQPQETGYLTDSIVNGFHYNFINNVSTNVLKIAIGLNSVNYVDPSTYDCYEISPIPDFMTEFGYTGASIYTLDNIPAKKRYNFDPSEFVDKFIIEKDDSSYTYNVLLSNDTLAVFSNSETAPIDDTCTSVTEAGGSQRTLYGTIREERVVSLKYLENEFSDLYNNNYDDLKQQLGVPKSYDFAIVSNDLGISLSKGAAPGSEVISRDYVEKVLHYDPESDDYGKVKFARFSLQLWR